MVSFIFSNDSGMTEQELLDGLINQNREAIQYLVNSYQKNVIKTAYYFVANMEDAEDLSQEIFLEIIKSIGHYKKKSSLYTWIYRITVNKSLDHLRREKRRKSFKLTFVFCFKGKVGHAGGEEAFQDALFVAEVRVVFQLGKIVRLQ